MTKKSSRSTGKIRVAAVQMMFAATIEANLRKLDLAVRVAAKRDADAVLFPECATTGYGIDFTRLKRADISQSLEHLSELAARYRINLLVGTPVFKGRQLFNCLVVFDRLGMPIHCYAKCQLTNQDRRYFTPGDAISLFQIDEAPATAIICHERRYPELVRLACMAGAKILFHPNAGLDSLVVSKTKRKGNDGITARAFENAIYYVFANSVGRQRGGKWSAGDSKIVGPDRSFLQLADNQSESVIVATLDLANATRAYPQESMEHPKFLKPTWKHLVSEIRKNSRSSTLGFDLPGMA